MLILRLPILRLPIVYLLSWLLAFGLSFGSASAQVLDYIVALVNGDVILKSEFDEYRAIIEFENRRGDLTDKQLLDQMIMRTIQLKRAQQSGIRISDNQVNQRLVDEANNAGRDPEKIIDELAEFPGGIESFLAYFRDNMTIFELQSIAIRSRLNITEQDARNYLISEQGRNNSGLVYTIAFLSTPSDSVSENDFAIMLNIFRQAQPFDKLLEEIKTLYPEVNGKQLEPRSIANLPTIFAGTAPLMREQDVRGPIVNDETTYLLKVISIKGKEPLFREEVRVRHILLKPSVVRNNEHTQLLIAELRQRLVDGESFDTLAKTYSEDQATKGEGGNLDWSPLESFTANFRSTVEQLKELEISEPFQTPFGWHIVQLMARRQKDISEQQELGSIRNYLFQQRVNDELPRWLNQLRETSYIEIRDPVLASLKE